MEEGDKEEELLVRLVETLVSAGGEGIGTLYVLQTNAEFASLLAAM